MQETNQNRRHGETEAIVLLAGFKVMARVPRGDKGNLRQSGDGGRAEEWGQNLGSGNLLEEPDAGFLGFGKTNPINMQESNRLEKPGM